MDVDDSCDAEEAFGMGDIWWCAGSTAGGELCTLADAVIARCAAVGVVFFNEETAKCVTEVAVLLCVVNDGESESETQRGEVLGEIFCSPVVAIQRK